jgi:hypothetical protein
MDVLNADLMGRHRHEPPYRKEPLSKRLIHPTRFLPNCVALQAWEVGPISL